jgi:phage shock protein C
MAQEPKRLYRSRSKRMLGGVCGGLGEYLKIDPTVMRVIFVILAFFYGASLLIYLIMWVLVPEEPQSEAGLASVKDEPPSES